jgi:hypothetical protein
MRDSDPPELSQYQWSRLRVVVTLDNKFLIYYPLDELLGADGSVVCVLADGYLQEKYSTEIEAIVAIRRLKRSRKSG